MLKKILELKENQSLKGIIIALVILVVLVIGAFSLYSSNKNNTQEDTKVKRENVVVEGTKDASKDKSIKIEVINRDGTKQSYCVSTDKSVLGEVVKEVTGLSVEGDYTATGLFVKTVNGVYADYAVDQTYWAIYVNDAYGQVGIDSQPISNGDVFKFVHEGGYVQQ